MPLVGLFEILDVSRVWSLARSLYARRGQGPWRIGFASRFSQGQLDTSRLRGCSNLASKSDREGSFRIMTSLYGTFWWGCAPPPRVKKSSTVDFR